jgi:hypothetical protein
MRSRRSRRLRVAYSDRSDGMRLTKVQGLSV